jgi:hypothetical protein
MTCVGLTGGTLSLGGFSEEKKRKKRKKRSETAKTKKETFLSINNEKVTGDGEIIQVNTYHWWLIRNYDAFERLF